MHGRVLQSESVDRWTITADPWPHHIAAGQANVTVEWIMEYPNWAVLVRVPIVDDRTIKVGNNNNSNKC